MFLDRVFLKLWMTVTFILHNFRTAGKSNTCIEKGPSENKKKTLIIFLQLHFHANIYSNITVLQSP